MTEKKKQKTKTVIHNNFLLKGDYTSFCRTYCNKSFSGRLYIKDCLSNSIDKM